MEHLLKGFKRVVQRVIETAFKTVRVIERVVKRVTTVNICLTVAHRVITKFGLKEGLF